MMPALMKVEYFGGPADGDKRTPVATTEYLSVDGVRVHRYSRGREGMEWSGPLEWPLHPNHTLLMLVVGRDR